MFHDMKQKLYRQKNEPSYKTVFLADIFEYVSYDYR